MSEQAIPMCKACADANDPVKLRATIAALRASHAELVKALTHAVEIAENKRPGTWDDLLQYRSALAAAKELT